MDAFDRLATVDKGYSSAVSMESDGTAYQAQISIGGRRSSDKEFSSAGCELARPISRIVLGLSGAKVRPIRRTECLIFPVGQWDTDGLTV